MCGSPRTLVNLWRYVWPLLMILGAACSLDTRGTDVAEEEPPATWSSAFDAPTARILVLKGSGQLEELSVPPVGGTVGSGGTGHARRTARLTTKDTVVVGNDNVDIEPGFMFLAGAAAECGVYPNSGEAHGVAQSPMVPPWPDNGWSVFARAPGSCDEALLYATALTCISDKLEALASALEPSRWNKVAHLDENTFPDSWSDHIGSPWIIPPMAPESRVVVRDLSRYALSQIVLLETLRIGVVDDTCATIYARVTQGVDNSLSQLAFGTPLGGTADYPSLATGKEETVTPANASELARQRLLVMGNNLRAANRLLETSVRSAVSEDTSEAERKRAMATDLVGSNVAAWGLTADGTMSHRFGTYGHALKVLRGRLEMGDQRPDPACGGVDARDMVSVVNGKASKLRPSFPKIITPGQQRSVCFLESLGLVVPDAEELKIDQLRRIVEAQAVEHAARGAGIDPSDQGALDAFRSGPTAERARENVRTMADGDLRLGLRITSHEYGMLLDDPLDPGDAPACGDNGLRCAEHVAQSVTAVGGIVLRSGMPKSDLTVHAAARTGPMWAASQCDEKNTAVVVPRDALRADLPTELSMSDPFSVGQAFGKRLVVLRELAAEVGAEEVESVARSGAAEVGAWAGRSQVAVTTVPSINGSRARLIVVTLAGVIPEDVGASAEEQLENQFVVVYGTPTDANCAAGLTTACSEEMRARRHVEPISVTRTSLASNSGLRKSLGTDGVLLEMRFRADDVSAVGNIVYSGPDTVPDHLLYVIQKHAPEAGNGKGKVIAAMALRQASKVSAIAVSAWRDQLTDKIVGVSPQWAIDGCRFGTVSPGESKEHCAGVPRHTMIPMENELMETNRVWLLSNGALPT